jgi:hypothetical protein
MLVDKILDTPPLSLPPKDHFSLGELAERWQAPMADIQYYALHGLLEVEAWLCIPGVRIKHIEQTSNNASAYLADFEGYVVVSVKELRKVFRKDGNHSSILLDDLVISREERERFERTHRLECNCNRPNKSEPTENLQSATVPSMSFPGRPSVMRRILVHFEDRRAKKILQGSLQKEGDYLVGWAQKHIADVQIPTARTIRNAIRSQYREAIHGSAGQRVFAS